MMPEAQPLSYAGPVVGVCPICQKRPVSGKKIYEEAVCKKCLYGFANRRQLAYVIDAVVFSIVVMIVAIPLDLAIGSLPEATVYIINLAFGIVTTLLFTIKDGFAGQSPGKRLMGVQVLDERTGKPIGFVQSFKRYWFLMFSVFGLYGAILGLILVLTIAVQMNKGPRLLDGFAKTRVIWKTHRRLRVFGGDGLACEGCGYDLRGNVSGKCSECGKEITGEEQKRLVAGTLVG